LWHPANHFVYEIGDKICDKKMPFLGTLMASVAEYPLLHTQSKFSSEQQSLDEVIKQMIK